MKFIVFLFRLLFCLLLSALLCIPFYLIFYPIFTAQSLIIPYAIYPFDICAKSPQLWYYIKLLYLFTCYYINFQFSNFLFKKLLFPYLTISKNIPVENSLSKDEINLFLGFDTQGHKLFLSQNSLFQNILITGTIGSGKTSSAMYPFTKQLIAYRCDDVNKIGMLILDVKGNYYKQVLKYAQDFNRLSDLKIIEVCGNIKYNPLDKPHLKPAVLANRLKTILTLFSPNNSESYWLDEAEKVLTECIKLCRIYNNGYVTFSEIHKLVNSPNYYNEKITILRNLFKSRKT